MIRLKERLAGNKVTIGSWVSLAHPSIPEIMAKAGFEWLAIDMEHSVIDLGQAQQLIQSIGSSGMVPLVRVGENNPTLIKRVMDAGAGGVIVPMVNTKDDALRAVGAVKYPPAGTRGVGLARAQGYGLEFDKYRKWLDTESVVIAQIEHIAAIDNIDDILGVDGIDATMIGPYDLSGSLGSPGNFKGKEYRKAIARYEEACVRHKKPMGCHVVQPDADAALEYLSKGYSFLAVGVDMLYLGKKCIEVTGEIKGRSRSARGKSK